jgi:hypothetical protein
MSDNLLKPIADSQIDFKSPLSEDLMTRYRDNDDFLNANTSSLSADLLQGACDSVTTTVIVDADPTAGTIDRDDKFNAMWLSFTSGTLNGLRYKVTDCDATANSLTFAEDLQALGAVATDTYEIIGHVHDAGNPVDLKDLSNIAEGQAMTQDLADAITDPQSIRSGTADASFPFITLADAGKWTQHELEALVFDTNGLVQTTTISHGHGSIPNWMRISFACNAVNNTNNGQDARVMLLNVSTGDFWVHSRVGDNDFEPTSTALISQDDDYNESFVHDGAVRTTYNISTNYIAYIGSTFAVSGTNNHGYKMSDVTSSGFTFFCADVTQLVSAGAGHIETGWRIECW